MQKYSVPARKTIVDFAGARIMEDMRDFSDQAKHRLAIVRGDSLLPAPGAISSALTSDGLRAMIPNHKAVKIMDRRTQLACAVWSQAMKDWTFDDQSGIAMGVGPASLGEHDLASALADIQKNSLQEIVPALGKNLQPLWLLGRLPNMTAAHLAIQFRVTGPSQTCGGGSLAGIQSLSCAARWLHSGEATQAVAGTSESYTEAHWQIALEKAGRAPTERASILLLSSNLSLGRNHLVGPISLKQEDIPSLKKLFPDEAKNTSVFCDSEITLSSSSTSEQADLSPLPTWQVSAEMEAVIKLFQKNEKGLVLRHLDHDRFIAFIVTTP